MCKKIVTVLFDYCRSSWELSVVCMFFLQNECLPLRYANSSRLLFCNNRICKGIPLQNKHLRNCGQTFLPAEMSFATARMQNPNSPKQSCRGNT